MSETGGRNDMVMTAGAISQECWDQQMRASRVRRYFRDAMPSRYHGVSFDYRTFRQCD
jgi:hypothetical protein